MTTDRLYVDSPVLFTEKGTPYLREPGIALIGQTESLLINASGFLNGMDDEFGAYLSDSSEGMSPGESVAKFAGQLCYLSFGNLRTFNKDAGRYFKNLIESGHGSVLEHVNYTVLAWGISRSVTHELVRHRAGFGFSQVSQRYVGPEHLRFVERPEFVNDETLHRAFTKRIDQAKHDYDVIAQWLVEDQKAGGELLSAGQKRDLRKKVQQAARAVLSNETEAPIVITANVRAWRHFASARASEHAEVEIRALAYRITRMLGEVSPLFFGDFDPVKLDDGTWALTTRYPKV